MFLSWLLLASGLLASSHGFDLMQHATNGSSVSCLSAGKIGTAIRVIQSSSSAEGAAFCSSFLPIAPHTVRTALHRSEVTKTRTVYTTTILHHAATITKTVRVSTCTLAAQESISGNALAKRDTAAPAPTPAIIVDLQLPQSKISRVCQCLHYPKSTITVTNTHRIVPKGSVTTISIVNTETAKQTTTSTTYVTKTIDTCPAPTTCGNQGLEYAVFSNPYPGNTDSTYSVYDPVYLKARSAGGQGIHNLYYSNITDTIGGIDTAASPGTDITVYNDPQSFPSYYFSLDHRGYLYAPVSGHYTIKFTDVDDIAILWTGNNAKSGWTRANAALVVSTYVSDSGDGPGSGETRFSLRAGQYLPIRIVFGQGEGPAAFQVKAIDPAGNVFLDSSSSGSPYVVRHSCGDK